MLLLRRILASLILIYGLALAVSGGALVAAGGSSGFLLAGLATAASGVLILLGRFSGLILYMATLAATILWSLLEVGLDPVQLAPRLLLATMLGLCLVPFLTRIPKRTTP